MNKRWWPIHSDDEIAAVERVLRSGRTNYYTGEEGQTFEHEWAAYTGAQYALTCSNGTTALECAIHALQLYAGTEILVPCRTFMATASAVVNMGHRVVLADIGEDMNVTVETLEARRTQSTRAVIVVHYAGLPCDIEAICVWARKHNLAVVEDCAHAHGARVGGKHVGTFGDVGCFSMCVGKIMSTGGEGGMVITNSTELNGRMAAYRDHGRYQLVGSQDMTQFEYSVREFGSNLRLTEMQSAIGRVQLRKLDGWVARRREIGHMYDKAFGWSVVQPGHALYMYTGMIDDRDRVLAALNEAGVPARLNGCPNLYGEPVFAEMPRYECSVADRIGARTLGLPCYPTMADAEVDAVCEQVRAVLG